MHPKIHQALGLFAIGLMGAVLPAAIEALQVERGETSLWATYLATQAAWSLFIPFFIVIAGITYVFLKLPAGHALIRAWKETPERLTSLVCLVSCAALGISRFIQFVSFFVSNRVKDFDLVGPAVAVASVIFLLMLCTLLAAAFPRLSTLCSRLPDRANRVLIVLFGLLGIGYAVVEPLAILTKNVPWTPFVLVGTAALGAVLAPVCTRIKILRLLIPSVLATLVGISLMQGPVLYSQDQALREAIEDTFGVTPHIVRFARAQVDADEDGYSPILGGLDCDDTDSSINPDGIDIPGNGVDEDCRNGDRVVFNHTAAKDYIPDSLDPKWVKRWNILLITVDALRPANMEAYGYNRRETSPNMTALAQNGLLFERAYAPTNSTRYTLPALFAGRNMADIETKWLGGFIQVMDENELLMERLQRAGWTTFAHLPRQLARGMWGGLDQGFDHFVGHKGARLKKRSVPALLAAFKESIRGMSPETPWAMWIHFTEPHEPYRKYSHYPYGDAPIDRYDAEIRATDSGIARIRRTLKKQKMANNTIIVITADHGEEFKEHGQRFHGKQLYEESILVPLIIHVPGAPAIRVASPVSLIDLPETIAQLTGISAGKSYGGISLAPALDGQTIPADRSLFIDLMKTNANSLLRKIALVKGSMKVIHDPKKRRTRMFDLASDPAEQNDLSKNPPPEFVSALDALNLELDRQDDLMYQRRRAYHVGKDIPRDIGDSIGSLDDLVWLGARVDTQMLNKFKMLRIQNVFQALSRPKDYRLKLEVVDGDGKVRRKWTYRPLVGGFPMTHLLQGEVLEDTRLLRFRKLKGTITLRMSVLLKKEVVLGPQDIGEIQAEDYY